MTYRRGWVAFFLFAIVIINNMDRVAVAVAAKPIASDFGLSPVALGYLFSSFLWTYVLCLIPIGLLVDRIGSKKTMGAGLVLWSVAIGCTTFTWNFGSILCTRLFMGAGESTCYPAGARVIRDWIPEGERGQVTNWFNLGGVAGPAFGALLTAWVVSRFGWRSAFIVLGLLGIGCAILWMIWYGPPERVSWLPQNERRKILAERRGDDLDEMTKDGLPSSLIHLLKMRIIWGLMLSQAAVVYNGYLFQMWLPTYLQRTLHLAEMSTGVYTSIPYLLTLVLSMGVARASDRLLPTASIRQGGRRYFVIGLMLVGLLVLTASSIHNAALLMAVITVVITGQITASSFNLTMANDLSENPRDAARVMSMVVFGGNLCGISAPIVTGYVIAVTGSFDWAFRITSMLLVVGAVISFTMVRGRIRAQHPTILATGSESFNYRLQT